MTKITCALMLVLISAAPALAECAWVLWSNGASPKTNVWAPFDSYERLADCKSDAEKGQTRSKARSTGDTIYTYVCLPDTVDPREPKGK